jgi:hypothetical protein
MPPAHCSAWVRLFRSFGASCFLLCDPHGLRRGLHSIAASRLLGTLRGGDSAAVSNMCRTPHNVYVQPPRVLGPPGVHTSGVTMRNSMLNSHAARLKRFAIICAVRSAAWPSHRGILAGSGGFNPSEVEFRILSTGTVYPAWAVTSDVSCSGRAITSAEWTSVRSSASARVVGKAAVRRLTSSCRSRVE